ncbi:uncharacterized protein LOC116222975 [Clupea harengus]|uniref:Uncharacterized protein LOC116222975 n=1 Tax=Clupea harengus TaxID=7950 RepID=A0A8M1KSI0_CLUHA|nr:uncharacterized protein LOC116222975 [Clupea harengus]
MKTELKDLGLWPGSRAVRNPGNTISLWRLPPQPELINTVAELPSPNFFQLHPFFIWKPESDIMARLRNNYILPCLHSCPHPQVVSAGVGRPRVIVGTSGQYYILSSRLCCKACRRNWFADSPRWLEKLPKRFFNLLPAFLTYKKAICKSVMDELRRIGKSPNDMANQVNEVMHLKYERAHLAYLQTTESVMNAEAGVYGQRTIGQFLRKENQSRAFGLYEDPNGWCGVSVSSYYVKHLAKLINTKSSFNTSQETLLLTQQLWHSLTEGSETVSVPVVTMGPAINNPPPPASALSTPLSQESIDKIVEGIMEQLPAAATTAAAATAEEKADKDLSCLWTAQVSI